MSVELDPAELGFRRPFTTEVAEVLRLKNPNSDPVAFKVKTTAPKQYCVRPNSGRIEPGQNVEVQVLLQAMKEDPPLDAKCRDKFLVQSVAVSADQDHNSVAAIWSNIEQSAKSSIQERKIRVTFLPADGGPASAHASTPARSTISHEDNGAAYSSPGIASTPQQHSTSATIDSKSADSHKLGNGNESAESPAVNGQQSMLGAAAASIASILPGSTSTDDVKEQLAEAQATIAKLTKQIQESASGLRQRTGETVSQESKAKDTTATTSIAPQQIASSGVPVPLVAALCLLSFLLAYLLF